MKHIIYIHGFDGENSKKPSILQEYFDKENYTLHSFNQNPLSPKTTLEDLKTQILKIKKSNSVFLIGSSRGSIYTFNVGQICEVPYLLINPGFSPSDTVNEIMKERYGDETTNIIITELQNIIDENRTLNHNMNLENLFLSKNDELVDYTFFLEQIANPRTQQWFEDTHRFLKFKSTLPLIKDMIEYYC